MKKIIFFTLFLIFTNSYAQVNHPKASPFSRIEQEVGLSKITITYSRPAVRGRQIFGDSLNGQPALVPYGRIWRVGANESTKFNVDSDIEVMGNLLPKGIYALYAFPQEDAWEVVFHKNIDHWGDGRKAYDSKEDAFRITIVPEVLANFQENFLIMIDDIDYNSANMVWLWEHTKITIPITVDTETLMQEEIAKQLRENPTAQTYYEVARYLQEQGKEYSRALEYLNKAIELGGDTYYFYRVKSLIEAALEDYNGAIGSAQKSMALAAVEDKDEFVRMNQKNIYLWRKLMD
ncbi:MAG: hypothetical protein COA50_06670 [Flavobacteriaceae bacterium]|nr:MAG: hypothetical protein COA50_06670 [Flavobacteriaceae bacterium]